VSAELAARRTAAAAVLADFRRATDKYIDDKTQTVPRPDYSMWAWRLVEQLADVLRLREVPGAATAGLGKIFQRAHGGDSWANLGPAGQACVEQGVQAVIDHLAAARPAPDSAAEQLAEVRQVLDTFRGSVHDRQYVLERIDEIVNRDLQ
jgi:hypothetical protein